MGKGPKEPTEYTIRKNQEIAEYLGIDATKPVNEEIELAKSHCLKSYNGLKIYNQDGRTIYDHSRFDFLKEDKIPGSVNPSLWLNGKVLYETGVYSVVGKDVIQVRGFDIANIQFVRGKTGWIVVDTGSTVEGTTAAIKAVEEALGEKISDKLVAVIISHSHGDHFGGIGAVTALNPSIEIYVPRGFEAATRDEYVYAGRAMKSRASYQVGALLPQGEKGNLSIGCGLGSVAGTNSYATPTKEILEDTTLIIDGIHVDFQLADETEAVANMQNYFHEYKALWVADNCIGTLHNIYTMRGAKVRDALIWAQVLYDTAVKYGSEAEVIFQGHSQPHWNTAETPNAVEKVLLDHAAIYKGIHDQVLAAVAKGVKPDELKYNLNISDELKKVWYLRPYYGTYETNVRAIFQKYLGFYDGNPIHLNPSTEKEYAQSLIEYVGSKEAVIEKARKDFEKGKYQIVAEMTGSVLQLYPEYEEARELAADALEQLGYQTESSIWRNGYLKAAGELRREIDLKGYRGDQVLAILAGLNNEQILQYLGLVIDYEKIKNEKVRLYLSIDEKEYFIAEIYQGILLVSKVSKENVAGNEITAITRKQLIDIVAGKNEGVEANRFAEIFYNRIVNLEDYPLHYIAPGI